MNGSGITKVYGPHQAPVAPGQPRYYAQRYAAGQPKPVTEMTAAEASVEETRRTKAYMVERPGTDFKTARKAILEDDCILKERARSLPQECRDEQPGPKAARHQDELASTYIKSGRAKTLLEARQLANAAAPGVAKVAGAADLGEPVAKAHVARVLNDAQKKLANLSEDDVTELLVTIPGKGELVNWTGLNGFLGQWAQVVTPRYPAGQAPRGAENQADAVNFLYERVKQRIRQERLRRRGFTD